jgi:hypothetical protein
MLTDPMAISAQAPNSTSRGGSPAEAQQAVDADVRQGAGEHRGDRRRDAHVDGRQPEVERNSPSLTPNATNSVIAMRIAVLGRSARPLGDREHLERPGRPVQGADGDEEQERPDEVDHREDERRRGRPPPPPAAVSAYAEIIASSKKT